ncbi:MAG: HD domain-containing protein [Candidatus Heimdallarchaeota archaeon]|nr:HD domain-containing protein [Candidatus Heimdallarchaeota archaeon]
MDNPVNHLNIEKRIADPIHGLIRLTELESKVLESPYIQRLRDVRQLGIAEYVYPGATHSRFTHSLGVLHNVTLMFDAAYNNWIRNPDLCGDIDADNVFSDRSLQVTRLAALCHDLGHLPYSHNLEPAIKWMADSKLISESFKHEQISAAILEKDLGHILDDLVPDISGLIEGVYFNLEVPMFSNFLISSAIDADRMDYLFRDSVFCGVDYGRFDKPRLLDSLYPYRIKVGGQKYDAMAIHNKGIESVEQFLLARHRMHQTIYLNRTVVGFEAGLRRAYFQISTQDPPWELPDTYLDEPKKILDFTDSTFFSQLKSKLIDCDCWLKDPLLKRESIRKMGPFYFTSTIGKEMDETENEKFNLLNELKEKLERPAEHWFERDHWVYVESKKQSLVKPLPKAINNKFDEFTDAGNLKNTILLINSKGQLDDPTNRQYGHTFLPHISGHTYHRFLFFSHKKDTEKLETSLKPLMDRFEEYRWEQSSLRSYF